MRALPILILLAGCAATSPTNPQASREGLSRELAGLAAGEPRDCLPSTTSGQNLTVVDSDTLVYREGSTIWVNQLRAACPGLRPLDAILVETQTGQYCRGDHIRSIEPLGTRSIPGPVCFLGQFTPHRPR
ncbi:MAG TPA: DUF6491 family protein [Allosphingosinicella sp.]|jgi:hypothetical protein